MLFFNIIPTRFAGITSSICLPEIYPIPNFFCEPFGAFIVTYIGPMAGGKLSFTFHHISKSFVLTINGVLPPTIMGVIDLKISI